MSFRHIQPPGQGPREVTINPEDLRKMGKMFGNALLGLLLVGLILGGAVTSFYSIEPEEIGVVKRFGKFTGTADPGLHFKLPYGIDTVQKVPAVQHVLKEEFGFRTVAQADRAQYSDADFTGESLMLTGDLNIIEVTWVVQFRIDNPTNFLFNVRERRAAIRDVSESVMRRIVGNRLASNILTIERATIAQLARDEIQEILDTYDSGIAVSTVELQDVVPPLRVQPAFNEVNVSRQERERMINEAEKRRNQQIPRVQGEALQIQAEAEGYARERVNRSLGEVARFNAILEEYRAAPAVTRQRLYLESITTVLPAAQKVIVVPEGSMQPIPLLDIGGDRPILQRTGGNQ